MTTRHTVRTSLSGQTHHTTCVHDGLAIIGRLHHEAKAAAKTLSAENICGEDGTYLIVQRLDKAYEIGKTNGLDADLSGFLDYSSKTEISKEPFISTFHTRVDKIASLNLDEKLKGHLLLRQADLQYHDQHIFVGAPNGSYDVNQVSAALRSI